MHPQWDTEVDKTTPSALRPEQLEAQDFLDRLAQALTRANRRVAASMWAIPAFVVADDGGFAVRSRVEVERFLTDARKQREARGIHALRAELVRVEWPSERIALAEVRWHYADGRGAALGSEITTYTLRRDDLGELRLCVALMHGATWPH